jgi:putative membrane protein
MRVLLLLFALRAAEAHAGEPLAPHDVWTAWRFEPGVVLPIAAAAILYYAGARRARIPARQRYSFWTGVAVLALALAGPIHPLGEVLFSAHMAQHEILMLIAAPLLVLSRPLAAMLWALQPEWRRTAGRWSQTAVIQRPWRAVTAPLAAWWLHAAALWGWHAPPLFQATLTSDWVHAAQHASFFFSALLFWWSLSKRAAHGVGVVYVFTTAVHTSILGALLTLSTRLWYPAYTLTTAAWGASPLEDQQLGGLIMWVPGGVVYTAAGLVLLAAVLRRRPQGSIFPPVKSRIDPVM